MAELVANLHDLPIVLVSGLLSSTQQTDIN
jgi:hypothetical protein